MITIHLILHSHIDPVWLWPWQSGLDMALATCRTACNLLDAHPDIKFTFGDAWAVSLIEQTDDRLFKRIQQQVAAGRWEIAGGWWVQPDCNLPSSWGLEKQIDLGKQYFEDRFSLFSRIGFNIDSFGHAATIPQIMRSRGQDRYVMMRPMQNHLKLPARLFRWRGSEGGGEVTTFRIATEYQARPPLDDRLEHIRSSMRDLPDGVEHTMCFIGVGDHGGGVTEKMVEWCRRNVDLIPGAKLVFSSPSQFFNAVAATADRLPIYTGELQYEAVGCYSVHRPVKTAVRKAEHLLRQVELGVSFRKDELAKAWRHVCFHEFHDTLCGTCIPSAYGQVDAQLGEALAWADEQLQLELRRRMSKLPDDAMQRIVLMNASDVPFSDHVEFEPWRELAVSVPEYALLDEQGNEVAYQVLEPESLAVFGGRILFPVKLAPGEIRSLRLDVSPSRPRAAPAAGLQCGSDWVANGEGDGVNLGGGKSGLSLGNRHLPLPRLQLIEDTSDTWGHGRDRFAESPVQAAVWETPQVIEFGPLRATLNQVGTIGQSLLRAEWRAYAHSPFIELWLEIDWREAHKVLKLTFPLSGLSELRTDGIPGGQLSRRNDGAERPVRDWSLLELEGADRFGVVCPDVYALDATSQRLRLTLLRSPVMAHHAPHGGVSPRRRFADRRLHSFRFRLLGGAALHGNVLEQHATSMQRPPIIADLTRGMPPLVDEGWYNQLRR